MAEKRCPCGRMRYVDSEAGSGWWCDGMRAFEEGVCPFCHHLLYKGGDVGAVEEMELAAREKAATVAANQEGVEE